MALDPCVKQILCALEAPIRGAIGGVISLALLEAQNLLASAQASLAVTQLLLAPVVIANDIAKISLDQFNAINGLIPTNVMVGCASLGNVLGSINDVTAGATADIDNFLAEASSLLSLADELQGTVDSLNKTIDDLNEMEVTLLGC